MTQLTVSITAYAPLERVRHVFTQPAYIMQRNHASDDRYCPAATQDLRTGGVFSATMSAKDGSMSFDFCGQYDLVEPMRTLSYTIGEMKEFFLPAGRKVAVSFVEDLVGGGVTVTEVFDAEEIHSHELQIAGRQAILENFKACAEAS